MDSKNMESQNSDSKNTSDKGKQAKTARCKNCGEPLPASLKAGAPPFCSERCRLNDLSKWFGENYRIASNPVPKDSGEEE